MPWLKRLDRRMPRARRRGDDPAHPSRPAHQLEQGRLAAGACAFAGARSRPPRLSQGDGGLGHRAHHQRLCRRRRAHEGGGPRWLRVRMLRPSHRSVLVAGHQQAQRRLSTARSTIACASPCSVLEAVREAVGPDFIVGCRLVADEDWDKGSDARRKASRSASRLKALGHVDFLNIIRGHIEHDAPLSRVIPVTGMAVRAASRFRRRGAGRDQVSGVSRRAHQRCRDRPPCHRRRQARHGRHDAGPHRRSPYREARSWTAARAISAPASARPIASTASMRAMTLCASTIRATGREATMPHAISPCDGREAKHRGRRRRGSGRSRGGARLAPSAATRSSLFEAAGEAGRPDPPRRQGRTPPRGIIGIVDWRAGQLRAARC